MILSDEHVHKMKAFISKDYSIILDSLKKGLVFKLFPLADKKHHFSFYGMENAFSTLRSCQLFQNEQSANV